MKNIDFAVGIIIALYVCFASMGAYLVFHAIQPRIPCKVEQNQPAQKLAQWELDIQKWRVK
jgi:hypothetical protein